MDDAGRSRFGQDESNSIGLPPKAQQIGVSAGGQSVGVS